MICEYLCQIEERFPRVRHPVLLAGNSVEGRALIVPCSKESDFDNMLTSRGSWSASLSAVVNCVSPVSDSGHVVCLVRMPAWVEDKWRHPRV